MTWGFVRPVVVLPRAATSWDNEQLRIVLLHELGHVRARDWAFNLIGRVVCALYWFHPGVWWVARGLREDCELACDDRVIAAGVRRSDYAELLLSAATALRSARAAAEPALALSERRGLARASPPSSTLGTTSARYDEVGQLWRRRRRLPSPDR